MLRPNLKFFTRVNNKEINRLIRLFILIVLSQILCLKTAISQTSGINMQNLSSVKVDELTDEQILSFWTKIKSSGISLDRLENEAYKRKMPSDEFAKLKIRIEKVSSSLNDKKSFESAGRNSQNKNESESYKEVDVLFSVLKPKIFGAELFSNKNLSFEPNLRMATPLNYQLGPDDELLIDIYGYSEESFNLKVSPDGSIRIPNVGIVQVSGLTIELARKRIIQNLMGSYDRIGSGETKVSITLGNIRSIKVTLIGEVNMPGTYTLPSLATVFNALYASGGPSDNGSMRSIQLIRNNKIVATLDVYEFLINGIAKGNIRLQDQDIIKVSAYETRVELKGQVKREGYFEVAKKENLKNVIDFAGGFTDFAYRDRIKVTRNTNKQKRVADVSSDLFGMFTPESGDVYTIDSILDRYENRVQIKGAVFRPGSYALDNNLTVSKIIKKADGVKEDAFMSRAIIYRLKSDNSLELLSFNVTDILSGKVEDIPLNREDVIQIASLKDLHEGYKITINGEVLRPGEFNYAQNMKIEDLIIAAGGLKESASIKRIDVSRRKDNADRNSLTGEITIIKQFEIDKDLKDNLSAAKFVLEPFDIVTIFPSPSYTSQKNLVVEGEVLYPAVYSISKNNERISDIIKRAGGITANGFAEGAILIRQKEKTISDVVIKSNRIRVLKKQSKDSSESNEFIAEKAELNFDIVGIDLQKILKNPGSKVDLFLKEGDLIRIPSQKQTVLVSGEVLYPVRVRYNNTSGFKKYVSGAGGFSPNALKKRSYIIYANGTAKSTKNIFFLSFYPKVKPGAEIVIPAKEEKKSVSTVEFATIATSLTSMVFLIVTFFK